MATPSAARLQAIKTARKVLEAKPLFLDTETTGLEKTDEIVEIAIIDSLGEILTDTLVRPSQLIPQDAFLIHGISNDMVQNAPAWPVLWMQLRPILAGRVIVAYNADFDHRMMRQSHERYRQPWRDSLQLFDLLKLYSQFRGEWDSQRRSWKYFSLEKAGRQSNISLPNAHRSLADTLLTLALLNHIANAT